MSALKLHIRPALYHALPNINDEFIAPNPIHHAFRGRRAQLDTSGREARIPVRVPSPLQFAVVFRGQIRTSPLQLQGKYRPTMEV